MRQESSFCSVTERVIGLIANSPPPSDRPPLLLLFAPASSAVRLALVAAVSPPPFSWRLAFSTTAASASASAPKTNGGEGRITRLRLLSPSGEGGELEVSVGGRASSVVFRGGPPPPSAAPTDFPPFALWSLNYCKSLPFSSGDRTLSRSAGKGERSRNKFHPWYIHRHLREKAHRCSRQKNFLSRVMLLRPPSPPPPPGRYSSPPFPRYKFCRGVAPYSPENPSLHITQRGDEDSTARKQAPSPLLLPTASSGEITLRCLLPLLPPPPLPPFPSIAPDEGEGLTETRSEERRGGSQAISAEDGKSGEGPR